MLISVYVQRRCHTARREVRPMAKATGPEEDEQWPCPGFTAHPSGHAGPVRVGLDWRDEVRKDHHLPDRQRVIDYTCACAEISYEFLSAGGRYQFRRVRRSNPKVVSYAGPWRRARADVLWRLLLNGEAR
jgi:hypothetical protein